MRIGLLDQLSRWLVMLVACVLIGVAPFASPADNPSEEDWEQDSEDLDEDDFPDLVGTDDLSGIMDEFSFLESETTVESAARHRQDIGFSPSAITVISREDIEASGASTVPDLLRLVPGMDVVTASRFFTGINARLAWTYENHMFLVLVDGREINIEFLGQPFWEGQFFTINDIQRIEIIRGPASSLYGANAFDGVVSITTRPVPSQTRTEVRTELGDLATASARGWVATRTGKLSLSLGAGVNRGGRFLDPRLPGVLKSHAFGSAELSQTPLGKLTLGGTFARAEGSTYMTAGTLATIGTIASVRAGLSSERFDAQIFWNYLGLEGRLQEALRFGGIHLADFTLIEGEAHTFDLESQYRLPRLWDPLLLIVGGVVRVSWVFSGGLLDASTFSDPASSRYHQPGVSRGEGRGGFFVHSELSPRDDLVFTGGVRLDYNSETGEFLCPRVAVVFEPLGRQFLRLSAARAFRKPSFLENRLHAQVSFPPDSPIQGQGAQDLFQEFMTRTIGGENLHNEEVLALEVGYRGEWFDGELEASLDLYYNLYSEITYMSSSIVLDSRGFPDLRRSAFRFAHTGADQYFLGGELVVQYTPRWNFSMLASLSHREGFFLADDRPQTEMPKTLVTLGFRFRTKGGLVGSLYGFARSAFFQYDVPNPAGLMEPLQTRHLDTALLVLAKLGQKIRLAGEAELEIGLKLFLPLSPFSSSVLGYYEMGGGVTPEGTAYGGEELQRNITAYLMGSI